MLKLGVMGSTKGTDLQAIIDAIELGKIDAQINMVISNNEGAFILKRAKRYNIPCEWISDSGISRDEFGKKATELMRKSKVDYVLLIGFMKILSDSFCRDWSDRILNVHPSLLPKYAGGMNDKVHQQVLENGESETGCTIHFVTEEVDRGPILIQRKCSVDSDETVESLKAKVQHLEGEAFIDAITMLGKKTYA